MKEEKKEERRAKKEKRGINKTETRGNTKEAKTKIRTTIKK